MLAQIRNKADADLRYRQWQRVMHGGSTITSFRPAVEQDVRLGTFKFVGRRLKHTSFRRRISAGSNSRKNHFSHCLPDSILALKRLSHLLIQPVEYCRELSTRIPSIEIERL